MLTRRIIPCLDVNHGRVVKGVKFQGLRDAGDPAELSATYEAQGADEIVVLDVSATNEARANQIETIHQIRTRLSIPLTVGGGVRVADDAARLLDAGADKVSVNTAAVLTPDLLTHMARRFGAQCTVVAIDAAQTSPGFWEVVIKSGKERTGINALDWAARAVELGAGEILLTSFDRDGTRSGYDLELLAATHKRVRVPIIASGGAATPQHMADALAHGADAVLAASIFHDGDMTVEQVKRALVSMAGLNLEIRL
jgi:imidazole glycerol-phosphate synthase subunit HisF